MDVKDVGLIPELFAMKVIDLRDKTELESTENSTSIIERLLSTLSRSSSDQWELFLLAWTARRIGVSRRRVRRRDSINFGYDYGRFS
jgi:hypothetical protein